jgi:hypothetical protein
VVNISLSSEQVAFKLLERNLTGASLFSDFEASDQRITLIQGQRTFTYIVTILSDNIPEAREAFQLELSNLKLVGEDSFTPNLLDWDSDSMSAVITIEQNDAAGGLIGFQGSNTSVDVQEGSTLVLPLTRTGSALVDVEFVWRITPISADTADFNELTGTAVFPKASLTDALLLEIPLDGVPELNETFLVELVSVLTPDAALDSNSQSMFVTIKASDSPFGVINVSSEARIVINEGTGTVVQLERTLGRFDTSVLQWSITPASLDFMTASGQAVFAGQGQYSKTSRAILSHLMLL